MFLFRTVLSAGLWAAVIAGCGDGDDSDGPPEAVGVDSRTYEGGHPLSTETDADWILQTENTLLTLTNNHRVAHGLNALVDVFELRAVSRAHSKHMKVHDFFAHLNPEGDESGGRLDQNGIRHSVYGENLAVGQESPEQAFQAWLDSPPHRANLDEPGWTHAGMGYWTGGTYGTYYTQVFIRR